MSHNRLAASASAYLLSAAHQPIHWHPWSDEAFAVARTRDRPVLLDIGAVWCHWCHVMDGESYEDEELARFLNQEFVCIKVDRDERPDVDARYQRAVQALTRQGGWPLTAFLTPDGEVFYGGTYFPPDGKYGRPGFRTVLTAVLEAYRSRRDQVQAQAEAIRSVVTADLDEAVPGDLSPSALQDAVKAMTRVFDPVRGGFGGQPKFPHPGAIAFLLNRWCDTRDESARRVIDRTLEGMGRGGVFDQLGGGFHRYSVDAEWIVPHFEKMSYDNSELLKAYLDAFALFGTGEYAEVARGIVRWVREVAADAEGGYAASQDADVGLDDDGNYFTWTIEEAAAELTPEEMEIAAAYYDIGTAGEMHHDPGRNVLFIAEPLEAIATGLGRTLEETRHLLDGAKRKLRAARDRRPAPFVDRTRYTNWNAMMASAMLRAGEVLGDEWARPHALETLSRIRRGERRAGRGGSHARRSRWDAGRPGAGRRGSARCGGDNRRSRLARLGGAGHGSGLDRLLGPGRRGPLRHRARPRVGAGAPSRPRQAGAGHADAFAERRGRHRLREAARSSPALRDGASGAKHSSGHSPAGRRSWGSTPPPTCWRPTGTSIRPRTS